MENGATARESTIDYSPVALPPTSSSSSSSSSSASSSSVLRPYRCETCQRAFRELATLRKHEQLHRADRPYVCQTCSKSFLWSSNLKVHERVHTGERPYKCKICHRSFTQSNDLRRHERNVHMRGKVHGFRQGAGRAGAGSQVNLAAYQAFAMQQRALLQRTLTYESYVHGSAATQAPLFPQPPNPPMMNAKEGVTGCRSPRTRVGSVLKEPCQPNHLHGSSSGVMNSVPTSGPCGLGEARGMVSKRMMLNGPSQGPEALQHSPSAGLQHCPAHLQHNHSGMQQHGSAALQHSPVGLQHGSSDARHNAAAALQHSLCSLQHGSSSLQQSCVNPTFLPPSTTGRGPMSVPAHLRPPHMLLSVGHGPYSGSPPSPVPPSAPLGTALALRHSHHPHSHPQPSFNSFRHSPSSSSEPQSGRVSVPMPPLLPAALCDDRNGETQDEGKGVDGESQRQTCDSIMDLSLNKRLGGRPASDSEACRRSRDVDFHDDGPIPALRTPGSESESEEKRDVTTTSATPVVADNGIHHCHHCNIVFSDFTMFHLHESLHLPYEDYPFRCPSCGKRCQDRIEFMFHTVWHVKYPHTIPNYEPFKENLVS